jgi:hypothetical protein
VKLLKEFSQGFFASRKIMLIFSFNMDAIAEIASKEHNPINFFFILTGNEDTFQDDGSKNPLNVSKNSFSCRLY